MVCEKNIKIFKNSKNHSPDCSVSNLDFWIFCQYFLETAQKRLFPSSVVSEVSQGRLSRHTYMTSTWNGWPDHIPVFTFLRHRFMAVAFKFCGSSAGYIFTVQIHWQMPSDAGAADGLQWQTGHSDQQLQLVMSAHSDSSQYNAVLPR